MLVGHASTQGGAMRRRDFVMALGTALWPVKRLLAQTSGRLPSVAVVNLSVLPEEMTETGYPPIGAFLRELRKLGSIDGVTVEIKRISGRGASDRIDALINQVEASQPNVIMTSSTAFVAQLVASIRNIP